MLRTLKPNIVVWTCAQVLITQTTENEVWSFTERFQTTGTSAKEETFTNSDSNHWNFENPYLNCLKPNDLSFLENLEFI